MRGIIALDIDGTLTNRQHEMPPAVERFLAQLSAEWEIIFITGRSFPDGFQVVQVCTFPHHYTVYNGAVTFLMPEKRVVRRHYLPLAAIEPLEQACLAEGIDFVVHMGGDVEERCCYRPASFDGETAKYLAERQALFSEDWVSVEDFSDLQPEGLCYAKAFGTREQLLRVAENLEHAVGNVIHDPLRPDGFVILVTHPSASKGAALREFRDGRPAIAAGDDVNDLSMLAEADVAVVMETAPEEVRRAADIIAPPADEEGIIEGLQRAMEHLR
jgi:5-amino-6-(5-phospho-D-ribitylamino)uracil phosphatase